MKRPVAETVKRRLARRPAWPRPARVGVSAAVAAACLCVTLVATSVLMAGAVAQPARPRAKISLGIEIPPQIIIDPPEIQALWEGAWQRRPDDTRPIQFEFPLSVTSNVSGWWLTIAVPDSLRSHETRSTAQATRWRLLDAGGSELAAGNLASEATVLPVSAGRPGQTRLVLLLILDDARLAGRPVVDLHLALSGEAPGMR